MLTKRTRDKITWIDIQSPTKKDIRTITDEYGVNPLVAKELLSPTLRPKVDVYDNHLYLILHFPIKTNVNYKSQETEIDFIIGKDYVITTHYQECAPLDIFGELFQSKNYTAKSADHAGYLFYEMFQSLYAHIENEHDSIKQNLKEIEERIFRGEEHKMVRAISNASKRILDFRTAIRPHQEILKSFEKVGLNFFGNNFSIYLSNMIADHYRIFSIATGSREILNELRNTNDSLLSTKTADTMRTLTILAFVTFPLSLVASIFGMNTQYLPIVGSPNDFWIILTGMLIATLGFFAFFKYKKWF